MKTWLISEITGSNYLSFYYFGSFYWYYSFVSVIWFNYVIFFVFTLNIKWFIFANSLLRHWFKFNICKWKSEWKRFVGSSTISRRISKPLVVTIFVWDYLQESNTAWNALNRIEVTLRCVCQRLKKKHFYNFLQKTSSQAATGT